MASITFVINLFIYQARQSLSSLVNKQVDMSCVPFNIFSSLFLPDWRSQSVKGLLSTVPTYLVFPPYWDGIYVVITKKKCCKTSLTNAKKYPGVIVAVQSIEV